MQDRILELEDEARQRERQQAEQIQEIRNAYEQQHRKLSEFTDFVRRYFPYVEKLIPVVNFLRERLGCLLYTSETYTQVGCFLILTIVH